MRRVCHSRPCSSTFCLVPGAGYEVLHSLTTATGSVGSLYQNRGDSCYSIINGEKLNSILIMHMRPLVMSDFVGCFISNCHLGSYACLLPVSETCRLRPQEIGLVSDSCDSLFLILTSLKYCRTISNFITRTNTIKCSFQTFVQSSKFDISFFCIY